MAVGRTGTGFLLIWNPTNNPGKLKVIAAMLFVFLEWWRIEQVAWKGISWLCRIVYMFPSFFMINSTLFSLQIIIFLMRPQIKCKSITRHGYVSKGFYKIYAEPLNITLQTLLDVFNWKEGFLSFWGAKGKYWAFWVLAKLICQRGCQAHHNIFLLSFFKWLHAALLSADTDFSIGQ